MTAPVPNQKVIYDPTLDKAKYGSMVARAKMLYAVYGITIAQYDDLLAKQNYVCAICVAPHHPERPLVVDHNHISGEVRGLLCSECNTGIGLLGDNIETIARAIIYLSMEGSYDASSGTAASGTKAPPVDQAHLDLLQNGPSNPDAPPINGGM